MNGAQLFRRDDLRVGDTALFEIDGRVIGGHVFAAAFDELHVGPFDIYRVPARGEKSWNDELRFLAGRLGLFVPERDAAVFESREDIQAGDIAVLTTLIGY